MSKTLTGLPKTYEEYLELCREVWRHNHLYFQKHAPEITDQEYDFLQKLIEKTEEHHPEWIDLGSPTQRVGEAPAKGFTLVQHTVPMLSLANTYNRKEIEDFIKRVHKLLGTTQTEFCCELKMDGVAISARYENGMFVQGITRGNGRQGDDVTQNMRTIRSLPLMLGKNSPKNLEVRGEVFMPHAVFNEANRLRTEAQEDLWANPRNAAAGSLKLLDQREAAKRGLSIVFYSIIRPEEFSIKTQYEAHQFLETLGLPTLFLRRRCTTAEEIFTFADEVSTLRATLPFDIDGIVVKLDNLSDQESLGSTGKSPRWAVAYKFAAEQATTQIQAITVQVGRTGILTPVAELNPVPLAGSVISRATLHNFEELHRKDIRVGDLVTIEKGGDVIPKVVGVDLTGRSADSEPWQNPTHCPACGTAVVKIEKEVAIRCPNTKACPEQQLRKLIYFAGKAGMDIDTLGEKVMEQLVVKGFVNKISDIYRLTAHELFRLEGFKQKSVDNLLQAIEKSKKVPLPRFIMALGIKHVGTGMAELLANQAKSLETLTQMTLDDLLSIHGVGDKVAEALIAFLGDPENQQEISELLELGVEPIYASQTSKHHPFFTNKTFVITGSFSSMNRQEIAEAIKARGGKVTESVTRKTDYLVVGESPGSKLAKAQELGTPLLDEKALMPLLA